MGTRAVIARKTGESTFAGRYHHWDGYPSGLGATLWTLYRGHFKRDLGAMLRYLLDDHPAGWSTINGADMTQPAGYEESGFTTKGPHCYCHGGRHEPAWECTSANAAGSGCEWAYVFDESANVMQILASMSPTGGKMVGWFGAGDDGAVWLEVGRIDLSARKGRPAFRRMESLRLA